MYDSGTVNLVDEIVRSSGMAPAEFAEDDTGNPLLTVGAGVVEFRFGEVE